MKFPKGISRKEIINRKKKRVQERLKDYLEFWQKYVFQKM